MASVFALLIFFWSLMNVLVLYHCEPSCYFVNEHNTPPESYVYYHDNLPVTLCFNLPSCRDDARYFVNVIRDGEQCIGVCGRSPVFDKWQTHCHYDDTTGVVTVQTEQMTREVTLIKRVRKSLFRTKVVLLQKGKIISFTLSVERKNTGEKTSDDDDNNNSSNNNSSISNDISSSSSSSSSSNVPIYVEKHSMVTLKCQWYPGKPARNASLRRNGIMVLSPQPDHHRHPAIPALNGTREMTHTIKNFTAKDDGVYTCAFETETYSVISSRSLWIRESSENRGPSCSQGPWFEGLGVGLAVGLAVLVVVLLVLLLCVWRRHWRLPCAAAGPSDTSSPDERAVPVEPSLETEMSAFATSDTGPYEQLQQRDIGLRSEYSVMSHPAPTSSDARDTGPYEQLQQRDIGLRSEYSVMSHPAPTSSDARAGDDLNDVEWTDHDVSSTDCLDDQRSGDGQCGYR
ncbi:hypothetical protein ACOMHN_050719 [Nucella lapillus]